MTTTVLEDNDNSCGREINLCCVGSMSWCVCCSVPLERQGSLQTGLINEPNTNTHTPALCVIRTDTHSYIYAGSILDPFFYFHLWPRSHCYVPFPKFWLTNASHPLKNIPNLIGVIKTNVFCPLNEHKRSLLRLWNNDVVTANSVEFALPTTFLWNKNNKPLYDDIIPHHHVHMWAGILRKNSLQVNNALVTTM